jgi:hypothetical protein
MLQWHIERPEARPSRWPCGRLSTPSRYARRSGRCRSSEGRISFGKLAWGEETGSDYDLKIAEQRHLDWLAMAIRLSPEAATRDPRTAGRFAASRPPVRHPDTCPRPGR